MTCKVLACALLVGAVAALTGVSSSRTAARAKAPEPHRKVFTNSVTPLPDEGATAHGLVVNAMTAAHAKEKMDVVFALAIPKDAEAKLAALVAKGEVVKPNDLDTVFAPDAEQLKRLEKWAKDEGFEVTHVSPNKTGVYVRGTVEQFANSLAVKMVRVTAPNGTTYNSAQDAPSLPADVAEGVEAIIGLQPQRQARKQFRVYRPAGLQPAPATGNAPPYKVPEVLKAYNADAVGVSGKGQTIAVLIDTFPQDSDTKAFWTSNGVPVVAGRVEKVNVKNLSPLPPIEGEESLDVQWTSGIAKDAKVRVYASGSLAFVDLDLALDRILTDAKSDPGLRQASISLGLGEQFLSPTGAPSGVITVENAKFLRLAALGVNVFVSSGDAGSNPDQTGHGTGGTLQAEWMATSPFVVGVGGTSLHLSGTGTVAAEGGWAGSGGGRSKVFARPAFQNVPGMPSGNKRCVPDVSALADPNTGAFVVVNGVPQQIGGTSLSAPVWAGFCALMNESRTKAMKPTLPFLNPLIYPLKSTPCFRDIAGGVSNGAFNTGPGYDMVTGIGVPDVQKLMEKLTH